MKIVMSSDNIPYLKMSKNEWEKVGNEKGWFEGQTVEASKIGWTLEKQADDAVNVAVDTAVVEKPELECSNCSYYGPKADFKGNRCPECKSSRLEPFSED